MERLEKIKSEILKENIEDIKLKSYFNKITSMVGEEYASLTLSANESIKKSISGFTSDLDELPEDKIVHSLLKSAVLSNEKHNSVVVATKSLIKKGAVEDLVTAVNCNLSFRKGLTRVFIKQSHTTNERLYEQKHDDDNTLGDLLTLYLFEKKLQQDNNYQLRKKGN